MKHFYKNVMVLLFLLASTFAYGNPECSQVDFNNIKIVCLTKGINQLTRHERALIIEKRLKAISNDPKLDPKEIIYQQEGTVLSFMLNEQFLFSLRPDDFVYPEGVDYKAAAEAVISNISHAILSDREARAPESMIRGGVYSAIATLVLILILFAFSKIFPLIYAKEMIYGKSLPSLRIQNWELIKSERMIGFVIGVTKLIRGLLTIISLYIYIPMVLSFFPQTANFAPQILNVIISPINLIFRTMINFIPNLFFIFTIGIITHYALKLIRFFFDEIERGNIDFEGFHKEWARPTFMLTRVMIIAFAVVMAFPYIPGSDSAAFRGVSVFLGILFSLGSSSAIANIIAGVVLTYMRPFRLGDIVKISDTVGCVIEKNLLVTRIRTIKNVEITIPNSMVLGSHMVNFSATAEKEGLVLHTTVTFGYDVPWPKIHDLLKVAARRTAMIETSPEPFILQTALNEFYVHYELNAYTKFPAMMANIHSELHQNIQDVFHENGLELIVPHYTNVRDGNETALPKEYRAADYKVSGFKIERG